MLLGFEIIERGQFLRSKVDPVVRCQSSCIPAIAVPQLLHPHPPNAFRRLPDNWRRMTTQLGPALVAKRRMKFLQRAFCIRRSLLISRKPWDGMSFAKERLIGPNIRAVSLLL
jgi:hypothetical protein